MLVMVYPRFLAGLIGIVTFLLTAPAVSWAGEPEVRVWTNREGVPLRGVMIDLDARTVRVDLYRGPEVTIDRKLLSDADKAYLEEWEAIGFGLDVGRWPSDLRPMITFAARPLGETKPGNWVYATPNFEFHCDVELAPSLIKRYSLAFESTLFAVQRLPLNLDPSPSEERFVVRLFKNRNDYLRAGGPQGSAGVYVLETSEILVPMASLGVREVGQRVAIDRKRFDAGTLIHEITHQVMHEWLDVLPVWFVEGFAEYLAAVPFDDARFHFRDSAEGLRRHLTAEYGLRESGEGVFRLDVLHPDDLMDLTHAQWAGAVPNARAASLNYRSALLFTYYLIHLQGSGDAASLVAYLKQAKAMEQEMKAFVDRYNAAVQSYNTHLDTYNAAVLRYNQELRDFRASVEAFNRRVRTYNRQVEQGLAEAERIRVEPHPGAPPEPPQKPLLPEILRDTPVEGESLDLSEAERTARRSLYRRRSGDELWTDMAERFRQEGIELRALRILPPGSGLSSLRATPIRGEGGE